MKGCQADLNFLQIDLYLHICVHFMLPQEIKLQLSRKSFDTLDVSRTF